MRILPFLIVLLIFRNSAAQNYRNIPVHGNLYFIDSLNYIFPIDPDSIKFENGDSVIYHFRSLRPSKYVSTVSGTGYPPDPGPYYNLKGDSWAGSRTILKSDSTTIWFAKDGDSIVIKNQAKTGDTWLVNRKKQTYGKVTAHIVKAFLGITDSVKYMTIGSLNTVTSEISGKEFWLTKNYGFIKIQDIYNFFITSISGVDNQYYYPYTGPVGNTTLFGSKLIAGTKTRLTERMVNDFNIDDEFHMNIADTSYPVGCDDYGHYGYLFEEATSLNLKIELKTINLSMDTIIYKTQSCGYKYRSFSEPYTNKNAISSFNEMALFKLPYRDSGDVPLKSMKSLNVNADGLLQENIYHLKYDYFYGNDTASSLQGLARIESSAIPCRFTNIEGMGFGYLDTHGDFFPDNPVPVCPNRIMVNCPDYIKKGDKTWGTPHSFSCDTLTPRIILGINHASIQKSIKVQPNPFSETLTIKSDDRIQNVNIYNLQLQLIKTVYVDNQEVTLNLSEVPLGLYIAEVILTDQRKAQYKIIKSD